MEIRTYKVYKFNELSEDTKQTVINNWYENEEYEYLSDNLTEYVKTLLKDNKITIIDKFKVYYDLSHSQGDGLCFIGSFKWKNYHINITHSGMYYHSKSTTIDINTYAGNEAKNSIYAKFNEIYQDICKTAEKQGYDIIEYRMSNEEFDELCQDNNYMFTKDGKIDY